MYWRLDGHDETKDFFMKKTKILTKRELFAMAGIGLLATNCVMADILPHPSRNWNRPQPVQPAPQPVKPAPQPAKPPVVEPPKPSPNDQKPPKPQPPNVLPDKPVPPQPVKPPAGEPPKVVPDKPVPPPPPPPKPSLWQRIKSWF